MIPPVPPARQLCAVNPPTAAEVLAVNVRDALRDINVYTGKLVAVEAHPLHENWIVTRWTDSYWATMAWDDLQIKYRQAGSCFTRPRQADLEGNALILHVAGSRQLADLRHPLGAQRPPEPDVEDTEHDLADAAVEGAPVVTYAHRPVNKYAGPATRPALVTDGAIPPRFRTRPEEARTL